MRRIEYKAGDQVGDLTFTGTFRKSPHGDYIYECRCACGNICYKKATSIRQIEKKGYINSCGCRKSFRKKLLTLSQL